MRAKVQHYASVRLDSALYCALREKARAEDRTLSYTIRELLTEATRARRARSAGVRPAAPPRPGPSQ